MFGRPRRCPYCGSERLMWDHARGYLVCMNCGAILEPLLDESYNDELTLYTRRGVSLRATKASMRSTSIYRRLYTIALPGRASLPKREGEETLSKKENDAADLPPFEDSLHYEDLEYLFQNIKASRKIKIALFYYLIFKMTGVREKDAVSTAASKIGVSERYLEKTIRALKGDLRGVLEKLGEEIARRRGLMGSLHHSQETTRTDLRGGIGEDKEQVPSKEALQKSA